MDIRQYIESGILSIYVLGVASEDERKEVEEMVARYPEIESELLSLQKAMDEYISHFEVSPPKGLKESILNQIDVVESIPKTKTTSSVLLAPAHRRVYSGIAASIALLIGSIMANFYLYKKWQNTEERLESVIAENTRIARNLNSQEVMYKALANELSIVTDPNYKVTHLKGMPGMAPEMAATLYWDDKTQKAFIYSDKLPEPPEGKQYQLWAVEGGEVWDAGVFNLRLVTKVKCFKKPEKFVITLERQGGVPKAEGKAYAAGEAI